MKVTLQISVSKNGSLFQGLSRDVEWSAVPKVDESVEIIPDGCSSYVRAVHFRLDGSVLVRLTNLLDMDAEELLRHGWSR